MSLCGLYQKEDLPLIALICAFPEAIFATLPKRMCL